MKKKFTELNEEEAIEAFDLSAPVSAHLSDEFKKLVEALHQMVREPVSEEDIRSIKQANEKIKFLLLTHASWKKVQSTIFDYVIENLKKIDSLEKEKNNFHQKKNFKEKKKVSFELYKLKTEILVLRRIFDAIIWTVFEGDRSTIRRLSNTGGISNFSAANLLAAKDFIDHSNEDEFKLALSTDLSTFVHVGDAILVDLKNNPHFQFVELKTGSKNWKIYELAQVSISKNDFEFENFVSSQLNAKDLKHYSRVRKQADRNAQILTTLKKGKGLDPNTGLNVLINKTEAKVLTFENEIISCWKQLTSTKTWAIEHIDGCLFIGMYNKRGHAFVGFNAWLQLMGCFSESYNIAHRDVFRDAMTRPLCSLDLPTELINQLFLGDVILFMCLDVVKWAEKVNAIYPNTIKFEKPNGASQKSASHFALMKENGKIVVVQVDSSGGYMGKGFLERIFHDFQRPSNITEMQLNMAASMSKEII